MSIDSTGPDDSYDEFARKMDRFMEGPTTTLFQQLIDAGVQLPEPELVSDDDIRARLWEVIAGLEKLRVYLEHTNHLNDRDLYTRLWRHSLREETPAIDEIGFRTHITLSRLDGDDAEVLEYLRYYADEDERTGWLAEDFPPDKMPAHEDLPFTRDDLLPVPPETVAEAAAWLRANWSDSAFATNRFGPTERALEFVNQLYEAGATGVFVDDVMMFAHQGWTPYADTLLVRLPDDPSKRATVVDVVNDVGKPDETDEPERFLLDTGQKQVRLWWD